MNDIDSAIVNARQRAEKYQDRDGLPWLAWSAWFLLMALASWLPDTRLDLKGAAVAAVCLLWLFIGPSESPVMLWLRSRITYPRTGFVALPQPTETSGTDKKRKNLQRVAMGVLVVAAVLSHYVPSPWISTAVLTLAIAIVAIVLRNEDRMVWFACLFVPCLWLVTWVGTLRHLDEAEQAPWLSLACGMAFLLLGSIRLLRYLKKHRVAPA